MEQKYVNQLNQEIIDEVADEDIDENVKQYNSNVGVKQKKKKNPLLKSKGSLDQESLVRLLSFNGDLSSFYSSKITNKPIYQTTVFKSNNQAYSLGGIQNGLSKTLNAKGLIEENNLKNAQQLFSFHENLDFESSLLQNNNNKIKEDFEASSEIFGRSKSNPVQLPLLKFQFSSKEQDNISSQNIQDHQNQSDISSSTNQKTKVNPRWKANQLALRVNLMNGSGEDFKDQSLRILLRQDTPAFPLNSKRIPSLIAKKHTLGFDQESFGGIKKREISFAIQSICEYRMDQPNTLVSQNGQFRQHQQQVQQETVKIFLKKEDFFGNRQLLYTILPDANQESTSGNPDDQLGDPIQNQPKEPLYPKTSQKKYTLILEMVDILLKILDTEVEQFYLQDIAIQELSSSMSESTHEIILVKYMPHPMLKALKDLQMYCELILYTFLPREFCQQVFNKIPELSSVFSHILCAEDMIVSDEYIIKDIGKIMQSRSQEEVIIIDTDSQRVDDAFLSSIIIQQYDGSLNYSQLSMLRSTIKQISELPDPLCVLDDPQLDYEEEAIVTEEENQINLNLLI
eukprot:403338223